MTVEHADIVHHADRRGVQGKADMPEAVIRNRADLDRIESVARHVKPFIFQRSPPSKSSSFIYFTTMVPSTMSIQQLNLNDPAFRGVNSTAVVLNAGSFFRIPKSLNTTSLVHSESSFR